MKIQLLCLLSILGFCACSREKTHIDLREPLRFPVEVRTLAFLDIDSGRVVFQITGDHSYQHGDEIHDNHDHWYTVINKMEVFEPVGSTFWRRNLTTFYKVRKGANPEAVLRYRPDLSSKGPIHFNDEAELK